MKAVPGTRCRFRRRIVEPGQPVRHRRRQGPGPGLAPARRQRPAIPARQQPAFDLPHHLRKAGVLLQPLQIRDTVAAREVQKNQRQDHLKIEPTLVAGNLDILLGRRIKAADLDQFKIDRQPAQGRHPARRGLCFILESKDALCHLSVTPLVIAVVSQTQPISLIRQDQRGFSIF